MTVAHLVVSVLAMASFFVDGQMTTDVSVTAAQLGPSMTTAGDEMADPLTTAAMASSSTTSTTASSTMSASAASLSASAASSTMSASAASLSASAASSTLSASAASSTLPASAITTSTNPVQTSTTVVSTSTTWSQSATSKAAASAANLPTSFEFSDPTYARTVAAVVGGCGLFILNTIFFVLVSLMLRYTVRMERHRMPKVPRKSLTGGGGLFYGGNEVQSNQALFAPSLSATNIVSGASDIQLDARGGRGVYHNRAFNSEAAGSSQATISADDGYKPIEIKSQGGVSSRA